MSQTGSSNSTPPSETPKVPTRPPTERERRDVATKFLLGLIQNSMISDEQAEVFPELKSVLTKVSDVAKECLKELL
jgi:hypothetical protein